MQNLYARIHAQNDRAGILEAKMGHPHRQPLILRSLIVQNKAATYEDLVVSPPPIITNVPPRLVDLSIGGDSKNVITVSANDKLARVSRSILVTSLVRDDSRRVTAWLGALVGSDGLPLYVDGTALRQFAADPVEYRIIHVGDRDCCEWQLILRRMVDR